MRATDFITELYDPQSSFQLEYDTTFGPKEMHARAYDRQGNYIDINFVPVRPNITDIEFSRNDSFDVTGGGDAGRVFATVLEAAKKYLEGYRPPVIVFTGKSGSRSKLYQRMVDRFAQQFGYRQQDITKYSEKAQREIAASGSQAFVLKDMMRRVGEASVSGCSGQHKWMGNEPYRHLVEKDIDEDMTRRGFLGALGAAATGAAIAKPAAIQPAKKAQPEVSYNLLSNNPNNEIAMLKAAKKAGLKGQELAQFMAQMKHESWDFERLKEKPQPGVKGYFAKKYDPKFAPKTAKILGNKHIGDGERYHGRGFVQLTGRDNYRMAGQALGIDLLNHPELASKPDVAAQIAVWYWNSRVRPYVNNFADTRAVTQRINPAAKGLENRHENFKDYLRIV